MNSVVELPTLTFPVRVSHPFRELERSPYSQTWPMKMVDLPPFPYKKLSDEQNVDSQVNKFSHHATDTQQSKSRSSIDKLNNGSAHPVQTAQPQERRITHHHAASTLLPSDTPLPSPSSASSCPETYLCTFCWRPHHQSTSPSRIIGRRARLACTLCYNALLDLAVC